MLDDDIENLLETDPQKAFCRKCQKFKTWPEMALDKSVKSGYSCTCRKCYVLVRLKHRGKVNYYELYKQKGKTREDYIKLWTTISYRNARNRAKSKKLDFSIDVEYLNSIYSGRCSITGIKFELYNNKISTYSPSLDRIDNTKGYVRGNLRYILYGLNALKCDMSDKDLYKICLMVTANKKKLWLDAQTPKNS